MRSIQEIFKAEFVGVRLAIIQKLRPDEHNLEAFELSFSESWPYPSRQAEVFALSLGDEGTRHRKIWAGFINDIQPSKLYAGRFRFYVDRFRYIGEHDLDVASDADFYSNGGGGGARIYAANAARIKPPNPSRKPTNLDRSAPEGEMERRLVWVRKNHRHFRDPVWRHWEGQCAVSGSDCNGLLVASHIYPWAKSSPKEQTDHDNGLLLSVPLDSLFDRGWISFDHAGEMMIKQSLTAETRQVFGLAEGKMRIGNMKKVTATMRAYLKRHRAFHGFATSRSR